MLPEVNVITSRACAETLEATCTYLYCITTRGFTFKAPQKFKTKIAS